jgi:hypothetical protein
MSCLANSHPVRQLAHASAIVMIHQLQYHIHAHFNYSTQSHAPKVTWCAERCINDVHSNCLRRDKTWAQYSFKQLHCMLRSTVSLPHYSHQIDSYSACSNRHAWPPHHLQTLSGEITQHTQLQLLSRLCTWPPIVPLLRPLSFNWPCPTGPPCSTGPSFIAAVIVRPTISSFSSSP